MSGRTYSFKSAPNDRFFEKLFIAILFTLRVFARNRRRNTGPGFTSNKPTHYLRDYGDFSVINLYNFFNIHFLLMLTVYDMDWVHNLSDPIKVLCINFMFNAIKYVILSKNLILIFCFLWKYNITTNGKPWNGKKKKKAHIDFDENY